MRSVLLRECGVESAQDFQFVKTSGIGTSNNSQPITFGKGIKTMAATKMETALAYRGGEMAEKALLAMEKLEPDNPGLVVAAAVILLSRLVNIAYGEAKAFEIAKALQQLLRSELSAPIASA